MILEWTPDLSVGFDTIDRQHQKLFTHASDLFDAMRNGNAQTEISSMVEFLKAYVAEHFSVEDRLMKANHYPDLAKHSAQHENFASALPGFVQDLQTVDPDKVAAEIIVQVGEWLLNHVAGSDKELGKFLQSRLSQGVLIDPGIAENIAPHKSL